MPHTLLKALQKLTTIGMNVVDPPFQLLEKHLTTASLLNAKNTPHPIFVIGAPRSGSTLIYKTLTDSFNFSYISNFSSAFYRTIYIGTYLSQFFGIKPVLGYEIDYGSLRGLGAPHECGAFWYRWFPRGIDIYTPEGKLSTLAQEQIQREILSVTMLTGKPMIFKNLFNSLRIGALIECFPRSVFIVCQREPTQNALSLLKGRIQRQGSRDEWWTLPPREIKELLNRDYTEQVAGQVHYINKQIRTDANRYGLNRFTWINYEDFCQDTHTSLKDIANFLTEHQYDASPQLTNVPESFSVRKVTGLNESDHDAVSRAFELFQVQLPHE